MPAYLYLALAVFLGKELRLLAVPDTAALFRSLSARSREDGTPVPMPPAWAFDWPAAFLMGLLPLTWAVYLLAWVSDTLFQAPPPLLVANAVALPLCLLLTLLLRNRRLRKAPVPMPPLPPPSADPGASPVRKGLRGRFAALVARYDRDSFYFNSLAAFVVFGLFLMVYGFFRLGDTLLAGASVFSDFAPHTAVIRSFSHGRNFPTGYPHFAGDGIQYHFMFFFLCGILEFLGVSLAQAMNLPSVLGLVAFALLLGTLAVLLTRRRGAFLLAPAMLPFRSSMAILTHLSDLAAKPGATLGSVVRNFFATSKWTGNTPRDDWGFWTLNVYANQRHLLLGAAVLVLVLFLVLPAVLRAFRDPAVAEAEPGAASVSPGSRFRAFLLSREAWIPERIAPFLAASLLLAALPYWHGSVLISTLLVLLVLAVVSRERLGFALSALPAVASSFLQARFFSGGAANIVEPRFLFGFIAPVKTLPGVLAYCVELLGVAFVLFFLMPAMQRRHHRAIALAFLAPFVFAFTFSLTPDPDVNHKYIILSTALCNIYLAGLLCDLWAQASVRPVPIPVPAPVSAAPVPVDPGASDPEAAAWEAAVPSDPEAAAFEAAAPQEAAMSASAEPAVGDPVPAGVPTPLPEPPPAFPVSAGRPAGVRSALRRAFVVLLGALLMSTGVLDLVSYINVSARKVTLQLDSPLAAWVEANTSPDDIFLTAPYHFNTFFLSGRKIWFGHSYYAWSAGHDTSTRGDETRQLFSGEFGDREAMVAYFRKNGIAYAILDDDLRRNTDFSLNEALFDEWFPIVATFPGQGNAEIHDLRR